MTRLLFYVLIFTPFLIPATAPAYAGVTFTDVTAVAGLRSPGGSTFSTWGDYDSDGDADLLFLHVNGKELYRNEGDGTFLDVTQIVGITDISKGASTGMFMDFDNDGDLDLFMGGAYGDLGDLLYENNGDGTLTDVSQMAGMKSEVRTYLGSISFDYDNDGLLDIFVTNWADRPYPNFLYHNEGNGYFMDIAEQTALYRVDYSDGIAPGDYDNDGDLDIFITRAVQTGYNTDLGNVLYRNEGNGVLVDVTQQAGLQRQGFDIDTFFWDYDNDGDLDLFLHCWPSYFEGIVDETNALYENNGDGTFTDVTLSAGITPLDTPCVGAYYGDYDNDGWLDLCITYSNFSTALYHNNGDGTFANVGREAGIAGTNTGSFSFVDYDNDGDLDIFTAKYFGSQVALYRNDGAPNHWLQLRLVGAQSNRDAIGARVKVTAGGLPMLREVAGCSGAGTKQDRLPLHFGLGSNLRADVIEIRWPGGMTQTFTDIPADQRLTIHEIEGLLVVIHGVFPAFGYPVGGMPVEIQGEHFLPGSRVFFGGAEASEVHVAPPSLITAVTPPGAKGMADVEVVRPDGKSDILKDGFRYGTLKITRIAPEGGSVTGGITVRIDGVGFQPGAEIQIGGKPIANPFVTTMLIRGILPSGDPGAVDVSVTNPDGEGDMLKRAFTYFPPPTIGRVSPIFVPLMRPEEITIRGTGFIRTPDVHVGGVGALSVDFISSDVLNIRTPTTMPDVGLKDVVVINPDGQRAVLPDAVTVLAPIEIKSVEPASGGLEGGTQITIVGEPTVEFGGRSFPSRFVRTTTGVLAEVLIGDAEASEVILQSDNVITAVTPPNTPGPKDVTVINGDGQGDTLRDAFTYNVLPDITRVIPNNGRLAGGTEITIHGSNFLPGARVLIGIEGEALRAASSVEVLSPATIMAVMPPGRPGSMDVVIFTPDKQIVSLPDSFTYNPMPTITRIAPDHGTSAGGTKLTIEGTGFLQGARVAVGKRAGTTMVKDDMTIEAVTPPNPPGLWDVRVINPDTQEAVVREAFVSVGELVYNYPNPFLASQGTTFRYVTNQRVDVITVQIFNLRGVPIGIVRGTDSNEVRWHNPSVHVGLYVYLLEARLEDGQVKKFKNMLEVCK
jgi:hypothetical protein